MTRRDIEATVERVATSQHGVVTRVQLLDAGVSPDVVAGLVRSGRLRPVHRGVYTAGPILGERATEMAAALACGPAGIVSHRSAIVTWELVRGAVRPAEVDITLVAGIRRRPGIRIHRVATLCAEEVTTFESIPVTIPARTLLDAAVTLGQRDLERALAEALARRLTTMEEIRQLLGRHAGRKGARRLASIAGEGRPAFIRSEAEERLLALIRRSRLGSPETNVRIAGHEVDFLWRRERLVVEVDGFAYHSSRTSFEGDRRRDAALLAAGLRVLRLTWRQITRETESVLVRLAQALVMAPSADGRARQPGTTDLEIGGAPLASTNSHVGGQPGEPRFSAQRRDRRCT
jgi:very-short-patch-repair endonuclease